MQKVRHPTRTAARPTVRATGSPGDPRASRADPELAVDRLLDAAEKLVAQLGLAVTDRAIISESGHRNNSAIHYHFGDRQGLLDAVWQRRTARVADRRTVFLDAPVCQGLVVV